MREPIGGAKTDYAVTVESGQSFRCAEPDEPAGIGDDAIDVVGGQPVRRREGPDGQQFAFETERYGDGRDENCLPPHIGSDPS